MVGVFKRECLDSSSSAFRVVWISLQLNSFFTSGIERYIEGIMKTSVGVCVVFSLALVGLGSAIKCYSCKDYTGTCSKIRDCYYDDACLTVNERGGDTVRQCIKYSECDYNTISQKYPKMSSFKYSCCTSDLCNAASVSLASQSVMGILLSLALFWWCVL